MNRTANQKKKAAAAATLPGMNGRIATIPTAPVEPVTGTWLVTPAVAAQWLTRNTANRSISDRAVGLLAGELVAGRWLLTHQGVAFGASGVLFDGQHRLAAIVKADTAAPLAVTCGLPDEALLVIDTGRHRSAADTLGVLGHSMVSLISSILVVENQVRNGDSGRGATTALVVKLLAENPDVQEAAEVVSHRKHALVGWMRPALIGWWFFRARRVEPERAVEFLDQVAYGEGLSYGAPALALRTRLSAVQRSNARPASRAETLFMLCSAWDAFCSGARHTKAAVPRPGQTFTKLTGPGMQ
jgi:hypothetical protein